MMIYKFNFKKMICHLSFNKLPCHKKEMMFMILSSIIRYVINILNDITKTKIKAIEFIGGIKIYG